MVRNKTGMSVYLSGYAPRYSDMFTRNGFNVVSLVQDADFVQFIGGADIDPSFYGEEKHPFTHVTANSDDRDLRSLKEAKIHSKPCVGICRGAQFLNAQAGGKLYQHVNNHSGSVGHQIKDLRSNQSIKVSSTHHQMMIPGEGAVVVAVAYESTVREYMEGKSVVSLFRQSDEPDYEVVWYPGERFLCYQPHPEQSPESQDVAYFLDLIDEFIKPLIAK
jgi:GMP synthase-like glutamine amidotransferase